MRIGAAAMAWMTLALAGCDRQPEPDPAAAAAASATRRPPPGGVADSVSAVLASEGQAAAGLSFLIEAAPVAGKPFALKLFFTASQPVKGLQFSIESADLIPMPADGTVNVTGGEQPAEVDVVLTAQKAGTWELAVTLRTADAAAATVYKVPVLVAAAG